MPYKGLQSLKIKEESVEKWANDLSPRTARNYAYYFLRYVDWCLRKRLWASTADMIREYAGLRASEKF